MTDEEGFSTKKKIEQVQVVIKESDETPSMKELFSLALTGAVKDMKTVAHKTLEKFDVSPKKIDVSDPAKPAKPAVQKQPVMDVVPNKTSTVPGKIVEVKSGRKVGQ